MTKRVFCYVRFSTKRQQTGDSVERQQNLIDEYLAKRGAVIAEQFTDLGVSAFKGKNVKVGALSRFLQRVKDNEINKGDTLIVESLDRISRQKELDTLEVLISILNAGIIIYTLADERIYDAASENQANLIFQINFIISRAHDESVTKQRRSVSAWKRKHEDARTTKKVMTKKLPYWLSVSEINGQHTITVVESRAKEVRLAFELAGYKLGSQAIATRLNLSGTEKRWTLIAVRHLLNSKSVYGSFEAFKTKALNGELEKNQSYEEIENYYPAIISKDEYYKVQTILQVNKETHAVRGRASKGFRNVFKGLITCLYCESYLHQHFTKRKGHEYMYLVCHKSLVKACPSGIKLMIPYRFILEPVLLHFKNLNLEGLIKNNTKAEELNKKLVSLKKEREDKHASTLKIVKDIESNGGEIPRTVMSLLTKLEDQVDSLEIEINMLLGEIENAKISDSFSSSLTRENIDSILETEQGRLKFNALLSENNISILIGRHSEDEETNMWIQFKNVKLDWNIRFNREYATFPGDGFYNYRSKTFQVPKGAAQKLNDEIYEKLKLDFTVLEN